MTILVLAILSQQFHYKTDFTVRAWGMYQEHITSCYTTDAGSVVVDAGVMFVGSNTSPVTYYSNHVIAQRLVNRTGFDAGDARYKLEFYVASDAGTWLSYPEDGPELSVQNTRYQGGAYETATAGFQWAANPWGTPHWNFWSEPSSRSGVWTSTTGPTVSVAHWYLFETSINYNNNTYNWARVCETDGGSCSYLGVDGGAVGVNVKWGETGAWITAEAENLWQSTCGSSAGQLLPVTVKYRNADLSY